MPRFVVRDFVRRWRARADDAHFAAQNVDQLWQFVKARPPQQLADPCNAWVVLPLGPLWIDASLPDQLIAHLIRAVAHRPEFEHIELAPVLADSPVPG